MQIATFDFHNTIAYCDPWFELEIRDLPAAVLDALGPNSPLPPTESLRTDATDRYRQLRRSIMTSGIEIDALDSVSRVFGDMGIEVDRSLLSATIDRLMGDTMQDLTDVPGAVDTVEKIIQAGTPVGIISSAVHHAFLEWALERFGLLDQLAFVATSASTGYYKSDVRIYQRAYAIAEATPHLSVHIGDSPRWDVDTASKAGIGTVLLAEEKSPAIQAAVQALARPDLLLSTLVGSADAIQALLKARQNGQAQP